jgi:hypothetical protein
MIVLLLVLAGAAAIFLVPAFIIGYRRGPAGGQPPGARMLMTPATYTTNGIVVHVLVWAPIRAVLPWPRWSPRRCLPSASSPAPVR